jgi:uncharacterized protein
MARPEASGAIRGGLLSGWAGLGRFWLLVLAVLGASAGILQLLGPPPRREAPHIVEAAPHPAAETPVTPPQRPAPAAAPQSTASVGHAPGRGTPGPIADPDPALLEPMPPPDTGFLPRISVDGREPMQEYAAGFDPTSRRPRVGLIVAGIGMNSADSMAAVRQLPAGVTLAVSPYASDPDHLLAAARIAQHEYLLSIPMEPQGFPVNDPDDRHALMTSLPEATNITRLRWALSRIAGYVGTTNALGPLRGERFSGMPDQLDSALNELAGRGLFFVDARPGTSPHGLAWNRSVDVLIDDDAADADTLDQRLAALAKLAQDRGSALGLVSVPRPTTLDRVTAWSNTLVDRGLVLAPVSALMLPPSKPAVETAPSAEAKPSSESRSPASAGSPPSQSSSAADATSAGETKAGGEAKP